MVDPFPCMTDACGKIIVSCPSFLPSTTVCPLHLPSDQVPGPKGVPADLATLPKSFPPRLSSWKAHFLPRLALCFFSLITAPSTWRHQLPFPAADAWTDLDAYVDSWDLISGSRVWRGRRPMRLPLESRNAAESWPHSGCCSSPFKRPERPLRITTSSNLPFHLLGRLLVSCTVLPRPLL